MNGSLNSTQIDRLLRAEWKGRIGCHARGRTYVVPVSYVYDGSSILGQTGEGLKVQMMRENPLVCFQIDWSPDISSWESVIVHGSYEELRDEAAQAAVALLTARLQSLATSTGAVPPRGAGRMEVGIEQSAPRQEVVYRIVIAERSGRYERM
ncbi:MAG: pyridoxamine 5'-phosphate oxidase family protein [Kofleriaceae bacterium]